MISAKNTQVIKLNLETNFGKVANVKGLTTDGCSEYVGVVVENITGPQLLQLAQLVGFVEDNLTMKRSGTGISVSFR